MATTVASIITSGRYDLRDSDSRTYDDAELLEYLNRSLRVLDGVLSAIKSDLVHQEDTSTYSLAAAANSVSMPTRSIIVREIWISSDQLLKKDYEYIYYKRKFISGTGKPYYFAEHGSSIIFEVTADDTYTLKVYWDQYSSDLTGGGNMPHSDIFNDALREGMVLLAKRRNEYDLNVDAVLHDHFLNTALSKTFRRQYKPKYYKLGF